MFGVPAGRRSGVELIVAVVLAAWFLLAFALGAGEVFVTPRDAPPLPLLIGVVAPIALFLIGVRSSRGFRELVLTADLRLMTGVQAWRFAGFGFLAPYRYDVLPGFFAWPAALGDMAIGLIAPWVLLALIRRPSFAASRTFVLWNMFGILDLVSAVGAGAVGGRFVADAAGAVNTGAMAHLPLVLIPVYLVPGS
jgi:hypothetical protein